MQSNNLMLVAYIVQHSARFRAFNIHNFHLNIESLIFSKTMSLCGCQPRMIKYYDAPPYPKRPNQLWIIWSINLELQKINAR